MTERWRDFGDNVIERDGVRRAASPWRKAANAAVGRALDLGLRAPVGQRYLFMLCPARSGSSVTLHVLGSNPAISSIGESHVSYRDERDLRLLAARTMRSLRSPRVRDQYFLDKLVFDYHTVSDGICARPDVRFLFLLREPLSNIASLLKAFPDVTEASFDRYYVDRLAEMVRYARLIDDPSRAYFLTYEQLTGDGVDDTLADLQTWLDVPHPFSTDYGLIRGHGYGRWGRGDNSENLAKGRIVSVATSPDELDLNPAVYAASVEAHRRTTEALAGLTAGTVPVATEPTGSETPSE